MAASQNTVVGTIALEDDSKAAMDRLSDALDGLTTRTLAHIVDSIGPEAKGQSAPPTVPQIIEWSPRTRPPRVIATCPACGVHTDSTAETFEIILPDDGSDGPTRVFGRLRHDHEDGSVTTWPYIADEPKPDLFVDIEVEVPDELIGVEIIEPEREDIEQGQEQAQVLDRDEPFVFVPDTDGSLSLSNAVHQALGAASSCWEDMSETGVFDSDRALAIGKALLAEIGSRETTDAARVRFLAPRDRVLTSAIVRAYDRLRGVGMDNVLPHTRIMAASDVLREVIEPGVNTAPLSDVEVGGQYMTQAQFDAASAAGRTEAERLRAIIRRAQDRLAEIMVARSQAGTPESVAIILEGVDKVGGE